MRLGGTAEVYDAEIEGLRWGAVDAVAYARRHPEVKHIHIFADNTSALGNAFDPGTCPGQEHALAFRERIIHFLNADETHTVELGWSPGHTEIDGNERADTIAKEAAEMWVPGPTRWTLTHAKRIAGYAAVEEGLGAVSSDGWVRAR